MQDLCWRIKLQSLDGRRRLGRMPSSQWRLRHSKRSGSVTWLKVRGKVVVTVWLDVCNFSQDESRRHAAWEDRSMLPTCRMLVTSRAAGLSHLIPRPKLYAASVPILFSTCGDCAAQPEWEVSG